MYTTMVLKMILVDLLVGKRPADKYACVFTVQESCHEDLCEKKIPDGHCASESTIKGVYQNPLADKLCCDSFKDARVCRLDRNYTFECCREVEIQCGGECCESWEKCGRSREPNKDKKNMPCCGADGDHDCCLTGIGKLCNEKKEPCCLGESDMCYTQSISCPTYISLQISLSCIFITIFLVVVIFVLCQSYCVRIRRLQASHIPHQGTGEDANRTGFWWYSFTSVFYRSCFCVRTPQDDDDHLNEHPPGGAITDGEVNAQNVVVELSTGGGFHEGGIIRDETMIGASQIGRDETEPGFGREMLSWEEMHRLEFGMGA